MESAPFELWFDFASPYSYLSVMRAEKLLEHSGLRIDWRPFLLGPIFRQKGWETSPLVLDPIKGQYMWRDVERRAARHGLPFTRPAAFPMNSLQAARIMVAARGTTWAGEFGWALLAAAFGRGADIEDPDVLAKALEDAGVDPMHWMARSQRPDAKAAVRTQTDDAIRHGIFGAPTFRVGDELFWGDDRLEDAIAWASAVAGDGAIMAEP